MHEQLFDLTGRVAVITGAGANGGLGHALALGLARAGADVAVPDIDEEGSRTTAREVEVDGGNLALNAGGSHTWLAEPGSGTG